MIRLFEILDSLPLEEREVCIVATLEHKHPDDLHMKQGQSMDHFCFQLPFAALSSAMLVNPHQ